MLEVRPFARHDRDGLTMLANRHIAAVLPGGAVPVATLLSQMERDPAEYVVDPWVTERATLVAIEADRVVAAAHLKRYCSDERASDDYRGAAEIGWLVCDPAHPEAGAGVVRAATERMGDWAARVWYADGNLPCLGVYGVPDAWPHVQRLLVDAGFDDDGGQIEVVYAGDLSEVPEPGPPPVESLALRRVVGPIGTSFEAWLDGQRVGVFEVDDSHGTSNARVARWADEANHWVAASRRGRGIGTWLVRHACAWLRLGGSDRLLAYAVERRARRAEPMEATAEGCTPYYARFGLHPITRTRRGWRRDPA
jgi:GNAT superfamily N-acetyltransferase